MEEEEIKKGLKEKIELEIEKANKAYNKAVRDQDKGLSTHMFGEITAFEHILGTLLLSLEGQ